jgi:group I intron endonuclease
MKKTGIYCIINDLNSKVYVGQSVNIDNRWRQHLYTADHAGEIVKKGVHVCTIDWQIKKMGKEHFSIYVLEECPTEKLDEREIYWIDKLDSFTNGYNSTLGGKSLRGEKHPRAIWTEEEVWEIRELYAQKIPYRNAWKLYKNLGLPERSFTKIWKNETWQDVHQDVYTPENKQWHKNKAIGHSEDQIGKSSTDRALKQEEIDSFCKDYANGMTINAIAKKYNRDNMVIKKYLANPVEIKKVKLAGIQVRNIETGIVFSSINKAAKWANCGATTLRNHLYDGKKAGCVPVTAQPAHWEEI